MFLVKVVLPVLLILVVAYTIWWGINKLIEIRRKDKFEKLRTANEEIESTLAAGAVAKEVTEEEKQKLREAKERIHSHIDLGDDAKM